MIHLQEVADDAMKLSASNGTVVEANIVLSHLNRVSPADGSDSSGNGDAKNGNGATPSRELPYMTSTFVICDPPLRLLAAFGTFLQGGPSAFQI